MPLVSNKSKSTELEPPKEVVPIKAVPKLSPSPYDVNLSQTVVSFARATGESGSKKTEVAMDLETHSNRRFMVKYHRYEPKVRDSTAIRTLKECARKYFLAIVLGRADREDNVIFA